MRREMIRPRPLTDYQQKQDGCTVLVEVDSALPPTATAAALEES
jgi:hypothetical protein